MRYNRTVAAVPLVFMGQCLMKLTIKQENFCLKFIECGNASEAYRYAYNCDKMKPETVNERSSRMLKECKISARIAELREPIIKRHNVTVDSLIAELEEARALALETAQTSAAVSATMGKAKLCGLDKQIVEQTTTHKMDRSLAERLTGGSKR